MVILPVALQKYSYQLTRVNFRLTSVYFASIGMHAHSSMSLSV